MYHITYRSYCILLHDCSQYVYTLLSVIRTHRVLDTEPRITEPIILAFIVQAVAEYLKPTPRSQWLGTVVLKISFLIFIIKRRLLYTFIYLISLYSFLYKYLYCSFLPCLISLVPISRSFKFRRVAF